MPIKIEADYREILIDILFAVIIVVGFERFLHDFLIEHIENHDVMSPPIIIAIFFFSAYFWVITHWISYHESITKYPYYRWRKFFVDIFLFSVMFVIANISFSAYHYEISLLLVSLLIVWYLFACMWHLSDRGLRPLKLYLQLHTWRIITYAGLFSLLLFLPEPQETELAFPSYRYAVLLIVILAMVLWNMHRLRRFTRKDSRFYLCKYISGYPGRNIPEEGQLELIRYPIKNKIGDMGKDKIKFECDNSSPIEILVKDINEVKIEPDQANETDLHLQIYCKFRYSDGTVEDIRILFDLNDEVIDSVGEGVNESLKRNKHGKLPAV
jgi:hypothetical protein